MRLFELAYDNDVASACQQSLKSVASHQYVVTGCLPSEEVLDIYEQRQVLSGEQFLGFEDLLAELKKRPGTKVKVHSFPLGKFEATVFTDAKVSELIGILMPKNHPR